MSRQETGAAFPRLPHRLHFRSPVGLGDWRMTGRINWPSLSQRYEAPPTCEWINDEGDTIWLPAQYAGVAMQADSETKRPEVTFAASWLSVLSGSVVSWSGKRFLSTGYIALFYLQLAADVA